MDGVVISGVVLAVFILFVRVLSHCIRQGQYCIKRLTRLHGMEDTRIECCPLLRGRTLHLNSPDLINPQGPSSLCSLLQGRTVRNLVFDIVPSLVHGDKRHPHTDIYDRRAVEARVCAEHSALAALGAIGDSTILRNPV